MTSDVDDKQYGVVRERVISTVFRTSDDDAAMSRAAELGRGLPPYILYEMALPDYRQVPGTDWLPGESVVDE